MKICMYTDTFLPNVGGAELMLDNLATRFAERGHRVVVLAPRVRGRDNSLKRGYRLVRYRRPFSKRFLVRQTLPRLLALHCRHRFDLIHCHAAYPQAFVAQSLKRWLGVPLVVRPHGTDVIDGELIRRHPILDARLRSMLPTVDAVIAQGRFLEDIAHGLGVPADRTCVIHNGVDVDLYRRRPCGAPSRPYLLTMSNLRHRKGVDVLLRAYARLDNPDVDLVIAGQGSQENELRALAESLQLGSRVRFVGQVFGDEKTTLFRDAVCYVCPSRREPFANVILEALAAELPVVATAVGGNLEMVEHEHNGLLVPPDHVAELAQALGCLLADPSRRRRFAVHSSRRAADFDWSVITSQYLALYEQVLARGPLSPPLTTAVQEAA
jgi:glycosyltransferase involved in cell wall biosynthesis